MKDSAPKKPAVKRDFLHVPVPIVAEYAKEAARLGCDRKALYRAALKQVARQFPLKKELVLA